MELAAALATALLAQAQAQAWALAAMVAVTASSRREGLTSCLYMLPCVSQHPWQAQLFLAAVCHHLPQPQLQSWWTQSWQ